MVDRTIRTILRVEIADFKRRMGEAASVVDRNAAGIDTLSNQVGLLGGALTGFAALAVTKFAQFDKQMSSVQAATRTTGAELDSLRQAAIRAGADTAFSATEAAAGIENLAKAGIETADILNGGLDGALALAAAGNLEVGEAAEIAAVAMQQFKLEGSDVGHVADLLAAGAGKAVGDVSDLSQALNQAGLIAAGTGLSIEETTGSLSAFASAGLIGSDAGTAFKTMLQVLSAPSTAAEKEMRRLGIAAYDANGAFVGMEALAGQLETAFKGKTDAERNSALATIFGSDATRAANELYNQGALGIRKWTAAVDDQGYAAEQARIQTDNLVGDLERLGGSFDTVLIQSGSGANDSLRQIVQTAEAVVDAIGEIPGPVLSVTTLIAGAGGLALLGVAGLSKLTVGFVEAKNAATALGISARGASLAAGGLGAAVAIGTLALSTWAQNAAEAKARTEELQSTLDSFGAATDATLSSINDRLLENQNDWLDNILGDDPESLIDRAERIGLAVEDLQGYILGNADATEKVTQATRDYIAAQGDELTSADIRARAGRFLTDSLDAEAGALTDAQKAAAQKKVADEAAGVAADGLTSATEGATGAMQDNSEAIEENWQAQLDATDAVLGLRDAQNQAEAAYDDATKALEDNGKTLDVATEKGRANRSALDDIAESGYDLVDSLRASGASSSELSDSMETTRDRFIKTARAMGASKTEANELADELNLIPKNISVRADVETAGAKAEAQSLVEYINGLNATITVRERHVSSGAPGSRSGGITFAGGGYTGHGGKYEPAGLVHKGEMVIRQESTKAIENAAPGLLSALNSNGAAALGLGGFASGGAVSSAQRDVTAAWRGLNSARDAARRARRAVREAEAAERRARRTDRESDDRAAARKARQAERALDRAEKRVQAAESRVDEATARRGRLRDERGEVRTQLRRGEIRDSTSSGLSGAQGVTDQIRDLANSGDVGQWRQDRLNSLATRGETELTRLYKQAERVEKKLTDARSRLEELQQVSQGVRSTVVGGFGLAGVEGTVNPWSGQETAPTGSALAAAAKEYAGKARRFNEVLKKLWEKSGSAAIVQEVAGYGVEQGLAIGDALLADLPSLRSLAASYEDIERYGGWAGATVARAVGGGEGLWEAGQAVQAAEAQAAAIDKRIDNWGKRFGTELAKALGIKARANGGPVTAGSAYLVNEDTPRSELFVPSQSGYVLNNRQMGNLSSGGPSVTHNWNITQYYPVNEPVSVSAAKTARSLANVGRR